MTGTARTVPQINNLIDRVRKNNRAARNYEQVRGVLWKGQRDITTFTVSDHNLSRGVNRSKIGRAHV